MHHYHVKHPGTSHYFEVHGDYAINSDGAYSRTIPGGGCAVIDGKADNMWLQVSINDIRNTVGGGAMGTSFVTDPNMTTTPAADSLEPIEWCV